MACKYHPDENISLQNLTEASLILKCNTDLNVVILIGLLRWRLGMKRHEIRAFLVTKGIYLSTGTISNRSLDFLLLFKQLHINKSKEIKALIERNGGMILHMDGTHRAGGRVVFVLQEGHDNIVIDADLIPSEAEEHVNPILSKFKKTYGSPLVVVRDMAKGLALSASEIFPNTLQQICQVHFIRNLEKDLIVEHHKKLKSFIVKHRLTSKLKALRNCHGGCGEDEIKKLQGIWVHIAVDYLLNPIERRVKWTSRPISYFVQYRNLGCSLSMFVKDLPRLREEYRGIRRGLTVPIADMRRISVLESFVDVLESDNQSSELLSILHSILGAEASAVAVC